MKTYCLKCKTNTDTDNIDCKSLKQKIKDYLCNQHVVFLKIKSHNL